MYPRSLLPNEVPEDTFFLLQNTPEDAKIMSWWDYGYQITAMANRTILVDNNTWNNTHISRVGQAMASDEAHAYEIMKELDVDYVLVIFGGLIGYSSDGNTSKLLIQISHLSILPFIHPFMRPCVCPNSSSSIIKCH